MDNYKSEVISRWGNTKAYKEYEQKTTSHSKADFNAVAEGLDAVLKKFAECKSEGNAPDSDIAQALVQKLQNFITNSFYACTDEILKGLGTIFTADERFTQSIDKHGENLAEYISKAIENYCK